MRNPLLPGTRTRRAPIAMSERELRAVAVFLDHGLESTQVRERADVRRTAQSALERIEREIDKRQVVVVR